MFYVLLLCNGMSLYINLQFPPKVDVNKVHKQEQPPIIIEEQNSLFLGNLSEKKQKITAIVSAVVDIA